jgi:hypothetical protein
MGCRMDIETGLSECVVFLLFSIVPRYLLSQDVQFNHLQPTRHKAIQSYQATQQQQVLCYGSWQVHTR